MCEEILFYMMHSPGFIKLYQTQLGIFPTKEHRLIANEILYYYEMNKTICLADFITYAQGTELKSQIMAILENVNEKVLMEEDMLELLERLKKKIKKQEIERLKKELSQEFDEAKKTILAEKILEIKGSVADENY